MGKYVPWSDPTECPSCGGEARYRDLEGGREWDPVRIDPTDLEEAIRVAEGPISLIRDSLDTLEALNDEAASALAADTRRLLTLWDRWKEVGQTRVERARAALNQPTPEEGPRAPQESALDAQGVNEHGVAMCECGNKRIHAWEPGEWCGDRVIPKSATPEEGR